MGVGRINVWVPDAFKSNCAIDNTFNFVATVQHCDGSILEWKGGRYQTKDGAWHQIVGDPTARSLEPPDIMMEYTVQETPATCSSKCHRAVM